MSEKKNIHLRKRKIRYTLVGLSILLVFFLLLTTYLTVFSYYASRETICLGRIYQLGYHVLLNHDNDKSYPAYLDNLGSHTWSWRVVLIKSYHRDRYEHFRFNETWDSTHNHKLLQDITIDYGYVFSCPLTKNADKTKSPYVAVTGPGTVWTEVNKGRLRDPHIFCPEMILIIETTEPKNYWAEPGDDASPEDVIRLFQADPGLKTNSKQSIFSKGHWPKHFIRADGSCGNFGQIKDVDELRRLLIVPTELLTESQDKSDVDK